MLGQANTATIYKKKKKIGNASVIIKVGNARNTDNYYLNILTVR